jgi:hypothetical protein
MFLEFVLTGPLRYRDLDTPRLLAVEIKYERRFYLL